MKIRLVLLVLVSAAGGYYLAQTEPFRPFLLMKMLFGTALISTSSMIFNQVMEIREDSLMSRTATRPLPAEKITKAQAVLLGGVFFLTGIFILALQVNPLTGFLAFVSFASYLAIYTPLKTKTSLCTIVGAIPGALPPVIGWAARDASAPFEAWLLFAIIFLWQMPHFLAIAWMHRQDYEKAGFKMLSLNDVKGYAVSRQMILYNVALLPVTLLPSFVGISGHLYFFAAFILGIFFIYRTLDAMGDLDKKCRRLFRFSNLYLAVLLLFMVLDKRN